MLDYTTTPDNLPVPIDDGAADHLRGMALPSVHLPSTLGGTVDVSALQGYVVVYAYPMTGQPGVPLPEGWDDIPGARGCTPQNMCYRDHLVDFQELGAQVVAVSTQTTAYQQEMAQRLQLPYPVLSDAELAWARALRLPVFEVSGMRLLKRLTMIAHDGQVVAVKYPIFPSHSDAPWALEWLNQHRL